MPPVHPHSALAVSTLQIWINCSIFTSISNFYIFTESFNSKYNITAHSIVSSSLFRSTQLNNCITQLLTLDHTQEVMIQQVFFLSHQGLLATFLRLTWDWFSGLTWISSNTLFLSTVNSIPSIASGNFHPFDHVFQVLIHSVFQKKNLESKCLSWTKGLILIFNLIDFLVMLLNSKNVCMFPSFFGLEIK